MSDVVKSGSKKVALPTAQAEGQQFARRVKQLSDQRDQGMARIDADFRTRLKALVDEEMGEQPALAGLDQADEQQADVQ